MTFLAPSLPFLSTSESCYDPPFSLGATMRRRDFLIGIGVAAWPGAARAQKPERIRRVGMLVSIDNPDIRAFQQELERHGWSEGRNIHFDYRVAPAAVHAQALAKELVAMQPDVIFTVSRPVTAAVQAETRTIPVVFTYVIDPIGAGFIANSGRPGCGPGWSIARAHPALHAI